MSRPGSIHDASVLCDTSVPCFDFGFATPSCTLPDSPEKARKRQQYYLQQAAAASRNIKIAELKEQVAKLQAQCDCAVLRAQVSEVVGLLFPGGANTLKQASHALINAATMLKHCAPACVLSLPAPAHCLLICLTCLEKNPRYFSIQTPGSVLCYFCKKSGTLYLPPVIAELHKEYTKMQATRDPTLLDEAAKHAKTLHNCISFACFDAKYQTESQTLLVELVHLNCLVTMLLLKQVGLDPGLIAYWPELSDNPGDDESEMVKSNQCYTQDDGKSYFEFKLGSDDNEMEK